MARRPILLWPDPRLSEVCAPVREITTEIETLASDMFDTMYSASGRGLAAPQVGAMFRLFVIDATWKAGEKSPVVMINPELVASSKETCEIIEGCLSIPDIETPVVRPERITLRWTDLDGAPREAHLDGIDARIAQHELDHLDGLVHFDRIDPKVRMALEAAYS